MNCGPDAAAGGVGLRLLEPVGLRIVGQCPTVPRHPGVDVGAVQWRTQREHTPVAIETGLQGTGAAILGARPVAQDLARADAPCVLQDLAGRADVDVAIFVEPEVVE